MGFVGFVCMCVCVREMDRERAEEGEKGRRGENSGREAIICVWFDTRYS